MPFILLGKGPDEDLRLISEKVLSSRAEAMAELSKLTADPAFAHWDAEVFVVDFDSATPVLLVRPASAAEEPEPEVELESEEEPEPEVEPEEEPEPEEGPEAAGEPEEQPEAEAEEELEPEEEPEAEEEPEVVDEPEPDPALAAVISDLESDDDTDAASTAEEPETTEEPESEDIDHTDEASVGDALKAALQRTAASLEAEGIVAPESVGPEPQPQPEAAIEPEPESAEEPEPEVAETDDEPQAAAPQEAAWPWDTGAGSDFSLSALEEPGADEGSLIRSAGDDDTMAASRPVILGAYGEPGATSAEPAEPVAEQAAEEPAVAEPEPSAEPEADATSDYIDLDDLIPPPVDVVEPASITEPVGQSSTVDVDPEAAPTCAECVYDPTCPNKEQLNPSTCGSFQWR
jgi:hypothetical protein